MAAAHRWSVPFRWRQQAALWRERRTVSWVSAGNTSESGNCTMSKNQPQADPLCRSTLAAMVFLPDRVGGDRGENVRSHLRKSFHRLSVLCSWVEGCSRDVPGLCVFSPVAVRINYQDAYVKNAWRRGLRRECSRLNSWLLLTI